MGLALWKKDKTHFLQPLYYCDSGKYLFFANEIMKGNSLQRLSDSGQLRMMAPGTFDRHWSGLASNLNRYRLLQDGFISRRATYAGQKVVTKPLVFAGSELLVNFSTSARGRMFVTLQDESGNSLRSIELFGDKVDRSVDFAAGGKVSDFAGKPVVVEFDMSDADLYSFRFR